jgi:hypothetical protein
VPLPAARMTMFNGLISALNQWIAEYIKSWA